MVNRTDKAGMLTAMFRDRESAERAYDELRARGYDKDEINVVMSEEGRKRHFAGEDKDHTTELGNKSLEGTGAGSAIGGTLGAIIGAVAAIGTSVAIPGLGLVVAGPLAAGLAGAGAGGLTGGLIGALIGAGIPEERAKVYETGVKEGNIVLGFKPHSPEDARYFETHFQSNRGEHIYY
ncbi:hypothetical protein A3841_07675 [Pontibacter flavimaris]|uniref:General stress protein n=2 Tax=Pontibacter flavimaris TaxID=1797110 RepID=A0A1Q5PI29_9BACT|nr:hypothetical protein A3841_07675 [Pontibacter flavimaris]